jgi:glycosyltransferase involved in cell wall biosynthesis
MYTRSLTQFFRKSAVHAVLAEYGPMGATLTDACKAANIPLVVHFHGFDAYHFDTLNSYRERYHKMFTDAAAIVAVSNDMRQQLISLGADPKKIYYNPYGVNADQFSGAAPDKASETFVFVGRFTDKKAPHYTIKAFQKVLRECPAAKLIMVGNGELWNQCKKLVNDLQIHHAVELKGILSHGEVSTVLQQARAFVQHSMRTANGDSEGTPNTILEAAATGLPIVSTRHAGIRDAVVHNSTGFLCNEGDTEAMADYMIKLARDPQLAGKMGKASREFIVANFSMNDRIRTLEKIISDCVSNYNR